MVEHAPEILESEEKSHYDTTSNFHQFSLPNPTPQNRSIVVVLAASLDVWMCHVQRFITSSR